MNSFTLWAYGEFSRVTIGHPLFAAQRLYRGTGHGTFYNLVFFHIMGKAFVITVVKTGFPLLGERTAHRVQRG